LKVHLNEKFYKDIHYIWCSEVFDSRHEHKLSSWSHLPPSSNPLDIYNDLKDAVQRGDLHSPKIGQLKLSMSGVATTKYNIHEISGDQKDEILFSVEKCDPSYWSPVLYIIPYDKVQTRLKLVPVEKRASLTTEYIVEDLRKGEFEIIQF
jgi:hypothetical protein